MMSLKLDCGRYVWVDMFSYTHTYAGLLVGRPDPDINERILTNALNDRPESPDNSAIHLIPPEVDFSDPEHPVLPPALLRAMLSCNDPINPACLGSALEVIWLTEECLHDSIEDVVTRGLRGLAWDTLASDFDW